MKNVVIIYAGNINSVRVQKIAQILKDNNYSLTFLGWNRYKNNILTDDKFKKIIYIINGGGEGTKILPFLYIWFIIKLFFILLYYSYKYKNSAFYAVNFECAFVLWLIRKIRNVQYIYDIWDEFAISHQFPTCVKKWIRELDKRIRRKSFKYIHVDDNRVSEIDSDNYVIIYNTPFDFYKKVKPQLLSMQNSFAVIGWLNNTRGLKSIYEFAKKYSEINFIIIGEFIDNKMKGLYIKLPNIQYFHFMPQDQLFEKIRSCRGIFSLYDPSIEINRLAASNKLYDSMMLSIPVVVNKGIIAADRVLKDQIGYVVDYDFNNTWDQIAIFDKLKAEQLGDNGRAIYLKDFEFGALLSNRLIPIIESIINN